MTKFHPRQQGDLGEAAAIHWLTSIGAVVSFPLFHSPDYDLVAEIGRRLVRVQVKTSRHNHDVTGHFAVQLATSGGNRSWTGVIKTFDRKRVDFLFVLVGDGGRWFIPASEIEGMRAISLGGDKYSEFQVGRTEPLDHPDLRRSKLVGPRGGAGVGEPGQTVNLVPSLLSGFDSHPPHSSSPADDESRSSDAEPLAVGRTKLSSHHQVAVPRAVSRAAGVKPGDRFRVESAGTGRFVMTRMEEYMDGHLEQLLPGEETAR